MLAQTLPDVARECHIQQPCVMCSCLIKAVGCGSGRRPCQKWRAPVKLILYPETVQLCFTACHALLAATEEACERFALSEAL